MSDTVLDRPAHDLVDADTIERFRTDGVVALRNVVYVEGLATGTAMELDRYPVVWPRVGPATGG